MISRMKYITRWGLMRSTREETLSEHTLETAMLTHALIEIGNARFNRNLDAGTAVLLALYHDSQEILTGDMPTPVKYHDESMRAAYRSLEENASQRLLDMLPAS
jgi:5'-deoxynucleotidase